MEKINRIIKKKEQTLQLAPGWKTSGYVPIRNGVLYNSHLSHEAKLIYWDLLVRCFQKDFSYPGYDRLMKDLSIGSEHTVRKALDQLTEQKLIVIKRRGQGKTNIYFLKF